MRNTNSSRARSTVQCSAKPCQPSARRVVSVLEYILCLTVDTRVPRFCVGPRLVAILLNTYGEENSCHRRGRDLNLNVARWVGQLNSNLCLTLSGGGVGANIDRHISLTYSYNFWLRNRSD